MAQISQGSGGRGGRTPERGRGALSRNIPKRRLPLAFVINRSDASDGRLPNPFLCYIFICGAHRLPGLYRAHIYVCAISKTCYKFYLSVSDGIYSLPPIHGVFNYWMNWLKLWLRCSKACIILPKSCRITWQPHQYLCIVLDVCPQTISVNVLFYYTCYSINSRTDLTD